MQQEQTLIQKIEEPQVNSPTTKLRPYHIELLSAELDRRKKKNPRYSLRAFAHFLSIDPGALSRILAGKKQISLMTTRKVVRALNLPQDKKNLFLASVTQERKNQTTCLLGEIDSFMETASIANILPKEKNRIWDTEIVATNLENLFHVLQTIRDYIQSVAEAPNNPNFQRNHHYILQLRLASLYPKVLSYKEPTPASTERSGASTQ